MRWGTFERKVVRFARRQGFVAGRIWDFIISGKFLLDILAVAIYLLLLAYGDIIGHLIAKFAN